MLIRSRGGRIAIAAAAYQPTPFKVSVPLPGNSESGGLDLPHDLELVGLSGREQINSDYSILQYQCSATGEP